MAEDLYTRWLNLPPGDRPPDYYTMLGLPTNCADPAVIEAAVHNRMERLDRYALHPDPDKREVCQQMMNEVARARLTLIDPERREAYCKLLSAKPVTTDVPPPTAPEPSTADAGASMLAAYVEAARAWILRHYSPFTAILLGGVLVVCLPAFWMLVHLHNDHSHGPVRTADVTPANPHPRPDHGTPQPTPAPTTVPEPLPIVPPTPAPPAPTSNPTIAPSPDVPPIVTPPQPNPAPFNPTPPPLTEAILHNVDAQTLKAGMTFDQVDAPYALAGKVSLGGTSSIGPNVVVQGGTIDLGRSGHLTIKGDPHAPAILRNISFGQDLGGSFAADDAVFENCSFRKSGWYYLGDGHSSKWTFRHCILRNCTWGKNAFGTTDYGYKFSDTVFADMKVPGPAIKQLRGDWDDVHSCTFLNCTIAATMGWSSVQCDFVKCDFSTGVYSSDKPLEVEAFILEPEGAGPGEAWTSDPAKDGKVSVKPAAHSFATASLSPWQQDFLQDNPAFQKLPTQHP